MNRRKGSLFLLYTYTQSNGTVGLLLHPQYYQRWKPLILKMWMKSKFVLWQPRYYDLLTEENTFTLLKYSFFFWKCTVNLNKFSSNTIFRWCTFGKFYIIKFNYFGEGARGFELFLIDHFAGDIVNKNIADKYLKNSCISVTHPILDVSVNTGCYIYNSLVALFICM